jgi:pyridoxine 5-phosphate synthase
VEIALRTVPDQATLVPERRQEVTTEGGLNLKNEPDRIADVVRRLKSVGVFASAFIDPDIEQVRIAHQMGFDAVELHTGEYANANGSAVTEQLDRLIKAGEQATASGLRLHGGHGLNYHNTLPVAQIPMMKELNIGHAIVSRAIFIGLRQAVAQMKKLLNRAEDQGA